MPEPTRKMIISQTALSLSSKRVYACPLFLSELAETEHRLVETESLVRQADIDFLAMFSNEDVSQDDLDNYGNVLFYFKEKVVVLRARFEQLKAERIKLLHVNSGGGCACQTQLRIYVRGLSVSEFKLVTFGLAVWTINQLSQSRWQSQIIEALRATVERVRLVSITHKDHFVNVATRRAFEANKLAVKQKEENKSESNCKSGFFADQFENLANFRAHYEGTGPEIWEQTEGNLDAFVAAAGTGGTLVGVSRFLKEKNPNIKCFLVDPPGSGLFNKVTRGVMYTKEEAEGKRLKNPFDTITEGVGINRLTKNFAMDEVDGAYRSTDREVVEMSRYLLKNDGLFLGSSSPVNCEGAVRLARDLGPGHTIVTILCDSGMRHLSKFYSYEYLSSLGLTPSATALEFLDH